MDYLQNGGSEKIKWNFYPKEKKRKDQVELSEATGYIQGSLDYFD